MLSLTGCTVVEGVITASYEAVTQPASKDAEAQRIPVTLISGPDGVSAKVDLEALTAAETEDQALDTLAGVMEATAKAIRDRGEATRGIPYFG